MVVDSLVGEHLELSRKIAKRNAANHPGFDEQDSFSVAMAALWECAKRFAAQGEPKPDAEEFEKCLRWTFNRRILDRLRVTSGRKETSKKRLQSKASKASLDSQFEDGADLHELIAEPFCEFGNREVDLWEEIEAVNLTPKQELAVRGVLFLGHSQAEVSRQLGVSQTRVHQILHASLRKIRRGVS